MAVYYKFTEVGGSGGEVIFVLDNIQETWRRDSWSQGVVYVVDAWTTDQLTTHKEYVISAYVKAGTGYPYATVTAARAAVLTLAPDTYTGTKGFILQGGDWDGSTWTVNANYPFALGSVAVGQLRMFIDSAQIIFKAGEPADVGELTVQITSHLAINIGGA